VTTFSPCAISFDASPLLMECEEKCVEVTRNLVKMQKIFFRFDVASSNKKEAEKKKSLSVTFLLSIFLLLLSEWFRIEGNLFSSLE
jgi:hypothetical protein